MIADWKRYTEDNSADSLMSTVEEIAKAPEIGSAVALKFVPDSTVYRILFKPLDTQDDIKDGEQWAEMSGRSGFGRDFQSKQRAKMFVEGILYQATR